MTLLFLVEICSRGQEKTPENGEKNGGHGTSSAVKDPRKSALSRRGAVFLDRTLILFIFLCTYGLMIGRRKCFIHQDAMQHFF